MEIDGLVIPRGWGEKGMENASLMGMKFYFGGDESVLQPDRCANYTMW